MRIEYRIEVLPEHDKPDGHFSFKRDVDLVYKRIERGSEWAWCCVRVVAYVHEFPEVYGDDYLGGCSYTSERDFKRGGYWVDMKRAAKRELLDKIEQFKKAVA